VDDNIRSYNGSTGRNGVNYIPSVDAVQEFKVKTSNFSAEYGRSAGYTVNATIRSGTNQYHGSVFEFPRNDKLDANSFVSNVTGNIKAKFRRNQFGGTFGGPVKLPGYDGRNRHFSLPIMKANRFAKRRVHRCPMWPRRPSEREISQRQIGRSTIPELGGWDQTALSQPSHFRTTPFREA
jgi:hypothetical protein